MSIRKIAYGLRTQKKDSEGVYQNGGHWVDWTPNVPKPKLESKVPPKPKSEPTVDDDRLGVW